MIAKVVRGSRAVGLMHYLLGPGQHEEHVNPTVIGSWDGRLERLAGLTPTEIGRLLEQPLEIQQLDPSKRVWHTSLRNHAEDRVLSNEEWVEVARDVLHRTGIAARGDDGAARWVLVRHDEDHVHLAAVLARQDTGALIRAPNDYRQARAACTAAEPRLGLTLTNRDGHGRPGRSRPEEERLRSGGEDLRGRLRRAVEVAASAAGGSDGFVDQLRSQGVMVETRVDDGGGVTGYRVAVAEAEPVWFGGSKLHRSLSWPQLQRQWEQPTSGRVGLGDDELLAELDQVIGSLSSAPVADLAGTDIPEATGALLRAAVHIVDGRFESGRSRAVDEFLRAVPEDRGTVVRATSAGVDLRTLGVALLLGDRSRDTGQRVVMAAILLVQATGQLRRAQNRLAQAQAAQRAAQGLAEDAGSSPQVPVRSSGRTAKPQPQARAKPVVRPRRPGPRRGPSAG